MSVTDEEDGVIIWLQHLKEVNICSAVDENKVSKLQHKNQSTQYIRFSVYCHIFMCRLRVVYYKAFHFRFSSRNA